MDDVGRQGSKAEMIKEQRISDDELKKMFVAIDQDQSGFIDEHELQNALKLYGIQFSPASSQKLLLKIDKSGRGEISFDSFKDFFGRVSDPEDLKMLMSAESQKFFDYKQMVDKDPAFANIFAIPPLMSCVEKFAGHADTVESVAWVSDTDFVSASTDGEVRKVSVHGREGRESKGALMFNIGSALYSMAVSRDNKRLLIGHGTKTDNFTMWALEGGAEKTPLMVYEGNNTPVYSVAFSTEHFASGSKAGGCCTHDPSRAAPIVSWDGHKGVVLSSAWSGKNNPGKLVTASKDGTVKVWDARGSLSMRPVAVIEEAAAGGAAWQALWRKDTEVLTCGEDYCIKRWDTRRLGEGPLGCFFGHSDVVRTIALSPCETFLVSGTAGGSVRVWLSDLEQLLQGRLTTAKKDGAAAKKRTAKLTELFENGDLDDAQELKDAQADGARHEASIRETQEHLQKHQLQGCTQSNLGLDGPSLPVSSLAWRDRADGSSLVAAGSHDQTIRTFEVERDALLDNKP